MKAYPSVHKRGKMTSVERQDLSPPCFFLNTLTAPMSESIRDWKCLSVYYVEQQSLQDAAATAASCFVCKPWRGELHKLVRLEACGPET